MVRVDTPAFLVACVALVALAGCGSPSSSGRDPTDDGSPSGSTDGAPDGSGDDSAVESVALDTLVDGLNAPVDIAFVPQTDRRYIAEQPGILHSRDEDGLRDEPVLDLRDGVVAGGERGLLGLALHPEFEDTRRLFVRYSAPRRGGTPENYSHTFVLAEFRVSEDNRAVPNSEQTILEIPEPQGNHNAGDVLFGPEGYLYVAVGDGGAGGDRGLGHVEDWYDAVEGGNGQDVTENLLGSLLRIDVDARDGDRPYGIPTDNPLVGREGLDEHYAWGLRNPWRMSFDGDDRYVADVG
jgi:glucose/arabinose dehydrogenase